MNENGVNVRVVEQEGRTVKSLLQRSDIQRKMNCEDVDCPVCLTGNDGKCCTESV